MYISTIYNQTLNESATNDMYAEKFSGIFSKLDIYAKNQKFIHEGYSKLAKDVMFTMDERRDVNEMLSYVELNLLREHLTRRQFRELKECLNEIAAGRYNANIQLFEFNLFNKVKDYATSAWDKLKNILVELPKRIRAAVEFIENVIKAGIKKASEFVKVIGAMLAKLGNSVKAAALAMGLGGEDVQKSAPTLPGNTSKLIDGAEAEESSLFKWVVKFVVDKIRGGEYKNALKEDFNYSDGSKQLDKWFLNHKDEWKEKSKNNWLFRMFISGTNAAGERMSFWKVLGISIIGSFLVCTLIPLIASGVFGIGGTALTIIVIATRALWVLKNVARIIINRTLTYKQSINVTGDEAKHSRLFDTRTIVSIIVAFLTPALFAYFNTEITDWLHSLFGEHQPVTPDLVHQTDPGNIEQHIPAPHPSGGHHIPVHTPVHHGGGHVPVQQHSIPHDSQPVTVDPQKPEVPTPEPEQPVVVQVDHHDVPPVTPEPEQAAVVIKHANEVMVNDHSVGNHLQSYVVNNGSGTVNVNNTEITNVYHHAVQAAGSHNGIVILRHNGDMPGMFREVSRCGAKMLYHRGPYVAAQMPCQNHPIASATR